MRNRELDGLRGLAALSVALGHCASWAGGLGPAYSTTLFDLGTVTPTQAIFRLLHVLFPADAAVVVFFVLSGYVLTRSLRAPAVLPELVPFVVRRTFRLLPVSIVAALAMGIVMQAGLAQVIGAALLYDNTINGPIWSLQIELYGSAFVFIAWALRRAHPANMVPVAGGVLLLAWFWPTIAWLHPYYLPVFLTGFALGMLIDDLPEMVIRCLGWMIGPAVLVLLGADLVLGQTWAVRHWEAGGAFVVVAYIVHRGMPALDWRPVQFLGVVSYPFYLLNAVGMQIAGRVLTPSPDLMGFALLAIGSLAVSLPLAWMIHRLIERPGIALGRRLLTFSPRVSARTSPRAI